MVTDRLQHTINRERLNQDFLELAEIGATIDGGISRLALSNEDLEARAWLADKFEEAGLLVQDDDAGNLSAILTSDNADAKTLLIGSHMDSVPNGGRYDSSVSTLAALECIRTIKEADIELPFHIEAIDFTDEEGNWQSLFGSRAVAGWLEDFMNDRDVDYGPFRAALFRAGIRPSDVHRARRNPESLLGYIELHIEQGYHLDSHKVDIGIVKAIIGRTTYKLTFLGEASHSGTTAIAARRDALHGAAAFITAAYELVYERYPEGIFNCGNLEVFPGSFNIIPAEAVLTMECRHPDAEILAEMEDVIIKLALEYAEKYRLTTRVKRAVHMPAAAMSPKIQNAINTACEDLGISHKRIISYAGHDAQILAKITDAGMIFIPSVDGISHSPKEFTEWHHIEKGANVLLQTILRINDEENP